AQAVASDAHLQPHRGAPWRGPGVGGAGGWHRHAPHTPPCTGARHVSILHCSTVTLERAIDLVAGESGHLRGSERDGSGRGVRAGLYAREEWHQETRGVCMTGANPVLSTSGPGSMLAQKEVRSWPLPMPSP